MSHLLSIDPNEPAPKPDSFQARVQAADALADAAPGPDDLAALYHTGGTTGLPKLLPHSHRNEVHTSRCAPAYYDFRAGDCMFNGFPLFHVAGAFVYGLSCLARGGSLLLPTLTGMRDPAFVARAWQWFGQVGVSHLGCVPTVLSALLAAPRAGGVPATLRVAMSGGSPLPNELALRFEREIGVPVRNIFGMTESAGLVSIEPVGAPRSAGSVGLRLPYTEVIAVPRATVEALTPEANTFAVAAARAGTPSRCPELDERQADDPARLAQATGVIAMRGPHVSRGYLDAARRLGTFTDDGWLLSGDLGHVMRDGRIVLSGRAKDVIIRSSHNIDPGLIEDAVMAHPSVAAAAAVGEPDAYAGELPVVFVLPKPGERIDADELARAIAQTIAEPPAVPKRVTVLEQMPMTAIGKIYKPALRVRAAQQKLDEIVARVAPDADLGVDVTEAPGGVAVAVRFGAGVDAPVRARVRAALGELAVPARFDEAG
ncbi:MAG: AMP-binding protein [Burkholderiaceae bacterium]